MGAVTKAHDHEGETGILIGWSRDLPDGRVELGFINDDGTKTVTIIENPEAPLGDAQRESNHRPGVKEMDKVTFEIERAKPGKFALRMKHQNGAAVVVADGRADQMYDLKESMEKVARGEDPAPVQDPADPSTWPKP